MALGGSLLKRLPLSTAMLYLAIGFGLGPAGLGLLDADPLGQAELFERLSEIAVIISLFVTGLKLSVPLGDARWYLPLRLATVSMVMTIVLITITGMLGLGLSLGAAVLLGSILAPTDPVLASDVQVEDASDRDRMRFSLSGEGGLNDGVAFPFVMLGLGLLGLHELGAWGWKWLMVDLIWGISGGLAIGGSLGYLLGKLVIYLRVRHREAIGLDEFLALGLIALAYGAALLVHTLGFVAVFAAGLALRRIEEQRTDKVALHEALQKASSKTEHQQTEVEDVVATDAEHASSYMTHAMLGFDKQLERIGELAVVLTIGAMLSYTFLPPTTLWFVPLLFLLIRPVGVWIGLLGSRSTREQRWLTSWFGIRGIGSIYYLTYAINHGLEPVLAEQLVAITLIVVSTSIVLHGISVTPLMSRYARRRAKRANTSA
ncbi:MAG: cation:proton antiporter [Rhodoferax sp.]